VQPCDVGSPSAARGFARVVIGSQQPRVSADPQSVSSRGVEAVELARSAGLVLDPWEAAVLERSLGVRADGLWAAFEVGLVVGRQNGKGAILEARELAGLFSFGERLLIHSAHQFDTSLEAFRRLLELIEGSDDLSRQVRRVSRSHGEEGIELFGTGARRLSGGQRVRFRTRTKGGGRGFSGDVLILDEAMILPETAHGALLPTLSARPNPQVWYAGSAVDQTVHEDGVVLARVRERGMAGGDGRLAYFEWSADAESPDALSAEEARDPRRWAQANPGLGIRISEEHVENERRSMEHRTFAVERLSVGDWPATSRPGGVIDLELWKSLIDEASRARDPVCFAVDASPDRRRASIAAAGFRDDELAHVEIVEHRAGTGWVVDRLVELRDRHAPLAIVLDGRGPAASLIHEIEERGVEVDVIGSAEYANACGLFFDTVEQERLRHLGTAEMSAAVRSATKRDLGDAWAWSRKRSSADISPLVASTLALWASASRSTSIYAERGVLVV
jgi:hypothetical protein